MVTYGDVGSNQDDNEPSKSRTVSTDQYKLQETENKQDLDTEEKEEDTPIPLYSTPDKSRSKFNTSLGSHTDKTLEGEGVSYSAITETSSPSPSPNTALSMLQVSSPSSTCSRPVVYEAVNGEDSSYVLLEKITPHCMMIQTVVDRESQVCIHQ